MLNNDCNDIDFEELYHYYKINTLIIKKHTHTYNVNILFIQFEELNELFHIIRYLSHK